jgi:DNA-binding transcriptional LysR family regulator
VVCAAPAYLAKYGTPSTPGDLALHRIIVPTGATETTEWRFGREQKISVSVRPRLFCNTNEAAISAAIAGWGLTRVLSYQIGPALADGRLQTLLGEFEEEPLPIHIVHPEGRRVSAKVRSFVDFAAAKLRANRMIGAAKDSQA